MCLFSPCGYVGRKPLVMRSLICLGDLPRTVAALLIGNSEVGGILSILGISLSIGYLWMALYDVGDVWLQQFCVILVFLFASLMLI